MLKLLDILKEGIYSPNPEAKKHMLSIQKNEKYSDLITKGLKKNPHIKEVEVIEFPIDEFYKTPTYKIIVHVNTSKIKDVSIDLKNIGEELYFILGKVLNNTLKLRDKIKFEFYDEEN